MLENMQKNECRVVLPPRSLAFGNWKRECIKTVLRILQRLCCNEVMFFFFIWHQYVNIKFVSERNNIPCQFESNSAAFSLAITFKSPSLFSKGIPIVFVSSVLVDITQIESIGKILKNLVNDYQLGFQMDHRSVYRFMLGFFFISED